MLETVSGPMSAEPAMRELRVRTRRSAEPLRREEQLAWAIAELCFEISLILYAEHGFNASTFTPRVVTSTLSDLYSAVTAAIGALKGPLHGGANEAVMHMMLEIDDPANAAAWLDEAVASKRKIMGFGHRVYKNGDSRVPTMKDALVQMAELSGGERWVTMYTELEQAMYERKQIQPNLDFPAGPA